MILHYILDSGTHPSQTSSIGNVTDPEDRQLDLIALPLGIATGIFLGSILTPTTTTTTTTVASVANLVAGVPNPVAVPIVLG